MTETLRFSPRDRFGALLKDTSTLLVQIAVGFLLVLAAGGIALMTAFVGVILAAVALVMRFAGRRSVRTMRRQTVPVTLDARRTPRGWTVE